MSPDEIVFKRLIFVSVLSMQYHPRNEVTSDRDIEIISRCLRVTELAAVAFYNTFVDPIDDDGIPF